MDKITEARDYIERYTKSAHALILFDEVINEAIKGASTNQFFKWSPIQMVRPEWDVVYKEYNTTMLIEGKIRTKELKCNCGEAFNSFGELRDHWQRGHFDQLRNNADIEKLIDSTKFKLAQILDEQLYQPVKEELKQYDVTHSLGIKKEMFKERMERVLDDLKTELLLSELEKSPKNKFKVLFLKTQKPDGSEVELQESDIPIGYRTYLSGFVSGSSSGTVPIGGQEMVHEVIVLRPVYTCPECGYEVGHLTGCSKFET
jgi:hypothetical protein